MSNSRRERETGQRVADRCAQGDAHATDLLDERTESRKVELDVVVDRNRHQEMDRVDDRCGISHQRIVESFAGSWVEEVAREGQKPQALGIGSESHEHDGVGATGRAVDDGIAEAVLADDPGYVVGIDAIDANEHDVDWFGRTWRTRECCRRDELVGCRCHAC